MRKLLKVFFLIFASLLCRVGSSPVPQLEDDYEDEKVDNLEEKIPSTTKDYNQLINEIKKEYDTTTTKSIESIGTGSKLDYPENNNINRKYNTIINI